MTVECGITTCIHNLAEKDNGYGTCQIERGIVLKWRLAADVGKGTIVFLECLNMEIPVKQ